MKQQDRIAKAYRGLTADQLAALAFHYMVDANDLEFNRVADAVSLKDYRCLDMSYQDRLEGFTQFAAYWAIEHWRLRTSKAETLAAAFAALRLGDDAKADAMIEVREQIETYLLALDSVLLAICAENNIDPADVRKMAGTEPYKPMRNGMTADCAMQLEMQSAFAAVMEV